MKIARMPKPLVRGVVRFFAALAAGVCMGMMVLAATAVVREVQAVAFGSEPKSGQAANMNKVAAERVDSASQVAHGQMVSSAAALPQAEIVKK